MYSSDQIFDIACTPEDFPAALAFGIKLFGTLRISLPRCRSRQKAKSELISRNRKRHEHGKDLRISDLSKQSPAGTAPENLWLCPVRVQPLPCPAKRHASHVFRLFQGPDSSQKGTAPAFRGRFHRPSKYAEAFGPGISKLLSETGRLSHV